MKLALVLVLGGCAEDMGPRLNRAMPDAASPGGRVALTGQRFCADHVECAGVVAQVEIGLSPPMVQAQIVSYDDTSATIEIPTFAGTGMTELVLTVDGHSSNALAFQVLSP